MPPNEKANLQSSHSTSPAPADLPPSYENTVLPRSTPSTTSTQPIPVPSQNPLDAISRLTSINFSKYNIPQAKISKDQATITTGKPELIATQYALVKFIHEQAALPPKPIMIVRGTHLGAYSKHGETIVDFELKFNLTSLLDLDTGADLDGTRSPTGRIRVKMFQGSPSSSGMQTSSGSGSGSRGSNASSLNPLEQWVKKFCDDKAENRSFTLHRLASNLPTPILEGMVRTLIASTRYRGKVSVEFPVQHAEVTVLRQSGNWFTNMLRLYPTKKYEVVEAVWDVGATSNSILNPGPGSQGFAGEGRSSGSSDNNTDRDSRAGLIAQAWWKEWQFAIWNGVLGGKKGWVTVEDWIEAKMGAREKDKSKDWGVDYDA
ncbi:uncharacterized protein Z518_08813 [Rhinocladiella mackenziei CBS 650.93]|uniref:Uncharacterized protein n=1 Tax=Rhinocladiella mackenziei CBS 650.93 TaxID=1442369 RepID=A0A0D2J1U8_9EURO|nr:uncharacterized protein Z518_08813 [Rhinocladiella mackenziei CBS 650.93]KIX02870.1 hypothetical protein Z518_08813 [Rhinocladiella mackenziei CBS 650.93]